MYFYVSPNLSIVRSVEQVEGSVDYCDLPVGGQGEAAAAAHEIEQHKLVSTGSIVKIDNTYRRLRARTLCLAM